MKHITLPRPIVNQILHLAQREPEREVCGLVSARDGRPVRCIPVANVADEPGKLFAMDPKQQIDAMRRMREQGEALFAIYHSHPTSPAEPSAIDIEQAGYPDVLYLIVSLNTTGVLELRGYRLDNSQPEPVHLEILED